jgi:hypothetical protein
MAAAPDAASLIGRESDVFLAKQISDIKSKANETWLTSATTQMEQDLKTQGFDITDPAVHQGVVGYLMQQHYGDPSQPNQLPWDPASPASNNYTSWPAADGSNAYKPYDSTNPKPNPVTEPQLYARQTALDSAWTAYVHDNPDATSRMSRSDWYDAQDKAYQAAGGAATTDLKTFLSTYKPTSAKGGSYTAVQYADKPTASAFVTNNFTGKSSADVAKFLSDPNNLIDAQKFGVIKDMADPANLPTNAADLKTIGSIGSTGQSNGGYVLATGADGKSAAYKANISAGMFHGTTVGDGFQATDPNDPSKTVFILSTTQPGFTSGVAYPMRMASATISPPVKNAGSLDIANLGGTKVPQIENPPGSGNWYAIVDAS